MVAENVITCKHTKLPEEGPTVYARVPTHIWDRVEAEIDKLPRQVLEAVRQRARVEIATILHSAARNGGRIVVNMWRLQRTCHTAYRVMQVLLAPEEGLFQMVREAIPGKSSRAYQIIIPEDKLDLVQFKPLDHDSWMSHRCVVSDGRFNERVVRSTTKSKHGLCISGGVVGVRWINSGCSSFPITWSDRRSSIDRWYKLAVARGWTMSYDLFGDMTSDAPGVLDSVAALEIHCADPEQALIDHYREANDVVGVEPQHDDDSAVVESALSAKIPAENGDGSGDVASVDVGKQRCVKRIVALARSRRPCRPKRSDPVIDKRYNTVVNAEIAAKVRSLRDSLRNFESTRALSCSVRFDRVYHSVTSLSRALRPFMRLPGVGGVMEPVCEVDVHAMWYAAIISVLPACSEIEEARKWFEDGEWYVHLARLMGVTLDGKFKGSVAEQVFFWKSWDSRERPLYRMMEARFPGFGNRVSELRELGGARLMYEFLTKLEHAVMAPVWRQLYLEGHHYLPLHDGIIVPVSAADRCRELIEESLLRVFGFCPAVKVKQC